jgi:hypothetical protein
MYDPAGNRRGQLAALRLWTLSWYMAASAWSISDSIVDGASGSKDAPRVSFRQFVRRT